MKRLLLYGSLIVAWSCVDTLQAGGWGPVYTIEIHGESFAGPLIITDTSIVDELSFWVGPGTGYREFMGPVNHEMSIVDWDRGQATDRPDGLSRFEVRFLLEPRVDPPTFTVYYEPVPEREAGYIYYPDRTNGIVTHSVEGTWRYASANWNEKVGEAIAEHIGQHSDL